MQTMIETEPPEPRHDRPAGRRIVVAILAGDTTADTAVLDFALRRTKHSPSRLRIIVHLDGAGSPFEAWSARADDVEQRLRAWIETRLAHHDVPYDLSIRPHRASVADSAAAGARLVVMPADPHVTRRLLASLRARRWANRSGRPVVLVAPDWPRRAAHWFVPSPERAGHRVIDIR